MHAQLYDKLKDFCEQYSPEVPADIVVSNWLNRFYNGDDSLHILVRLDDNGIIGHAVIDVQEHFGFKVIFCHQVTNDNNKMGYITEGDEYIKELMKHEGAACSIINVTKNVKFLEKKLGYSVARTTMIRYNDGFQHS